MSHNAHAAPAKFKLSFSPFWDVENVDDEEYDFSVLKS